MGAGMAKREVAEFGEIFQWFYKLPPDDPRLAWRIPFAKVVRGLQSIGGIAELARVNRKTVYRRKLKPGSLEAFVFVLDRWQGTPRPLVRHKSTEHALNLNPTLVKLLDWIAYAKANDGEVVRTWHDEQAKQKKWRRKRREHLWVNPQKMTREKRAEFAARKKAGTVFVYKPQGRITVAMLCTRLQWYRRKFYRWRDSLTFHERKLLEAALEYRKGRRSAGVWETDKHEVLDWVLYGAPEETQ